MQDTVAARAPMHLWIVGLVSLLWSGFGCVDYLMTRMRNADYLAGMMPGIDPQTMLAYIDGFPIWAQLGWGLGVWLGLAGSILLLIRSRHAVWAYFVSLIGALLGLGYQLSSPMPGVEGFMASAMPVFIILVAAGLLFYARAQEKRGMLR